MHTTQQVMQPQHGLFAAPSCTPVGLFLLPSGSSLQQLCHLSSDEFLCCCCCCCFADQEADAGGFDPGHTKFVMGFSSVAVPEGCAVESVKTVLEAKNYYQVRLGGQSTASLLSTGHTDILLASKDCYHVTLHSQCCVVPFFSTDHMLLACTTVYDLDISLHISLLVLFFGWVWKAAAPSHAW